MYGVRHYAWSNRIGFMPPRILPEVICILYQNIYRNRVLSM